MNVFSTQGAMVALGVDHKYEVVCKQKFVHESVHGGSSINSIPPKLSFPSRPELRKSP
jgi:hypothetical protein